MEKRHLRSIMLTASLGTLLLTLASCSAEPSHAYKEAADMAPLSQASYTDAGNSTVQVADETLRKMMIQHGVLSMETDDDKAFHKHLRTVTAQVGGVFVQDNLSLTQHGSSHYYKIRLRPEHFDSLVVRITEGPGTLKGQDISAEDATLDYMDMGPTVKKQQEQVSDLEARWEKAIGAEKDLLKAELDRIKAEALRTENDMAVLRQKTAWSTLEVTVTNPQGDRTFASSLGNGLHNGWTGLSYLIIGLSNIWPLLLLLAGVLGFLFVRHRRSVRPAVAG